MLPGARARRYGCELSGVYSGIATIWYPEGLESVELGRIETLFQRNQIIPLSDGDDHIAAPKDRLK